MKEGIGKMMAFPSIWGKSQLLEELFLLSCYCKVRLVEISSSSWYILIERSMLTPRSWGTGHWAGGPGDSKEDVKWLDERLREVGL
jgi:hypothetical protein